MKEGKKSINTRQIKNDTYVQWKAKERREKKRGHNT